MQKGNPGGHYLWNIIYIDADIGLGAPLTWSTCFCNFLFLEHICSLILSLTGCKFVAENAQLVFLSSLSSFKHFAHCAAVYMISLQRDLTLENHEIFECNMTLIPCFALSTPTSALCKLWTSTILFNYQCAFPFNKKWHQKIMWNLNVIWPVLSILLFNIPSSPHVKFEPLRATKHVCIMKYCFQLERKFKNSWRKFLPN